MHRRPTLLTTYPARHNGARVAVLASTAGDQPSVRKIEQQRRIACKLARLRLPRYCRVQLRDRAGDEHFLASVDVAIDHARRVRAVFAADRLVRSLLPRALPSRRELRFVGAARNRRDTRLIQPMQRLGLPAIDSAALQARGFERVHEPRDLVSIGHDRSGRPMLLARAAAAAWTAMRGRARADGIDIEPVSSFRSIAYQRGLVARKLKRGDTLEQILTVNAAPGYSEHHSGRAIDIGTPGCPALEEAFEQTPAFAWLREHAAVFGFRLSYPRGNRLGVIYEPWHWYYIGNDASDRRV